MTFAMQAPQEQHTGLSPTNTPRNQAVADVFDRIGQRQAECELRDGTAYIRRLRQQIAGEVLNDVDGRAFVMTAEWVRATLHPDDDSMDIRRMVDTHAEAVRRLDEFESQIDMAKHARETRKLRAALKSAGTKYEKACEAVRAAVDRVALAQAKADLEAASANLEEARAPFGSFNLLGRFSDEPHTMFTRAIEEQRRIREAFPMISTWIDAADAETKG